MSETILIKVDGMGCEACVRSVEKAVKTVDPAAGVSVDLASGEVRIEAAAAARGAFTAAIEKAGYDIAA